MILLNSDKSSSLCSPGLCFSNHIANGSSGRSQQPCVENAQLLRWKTTAVPSLTTPKTLGTLNTGTPQLFPHTESCSSCFLPPWTTSGLRFSFIPHILNLVWLPFSSPASTQRTSPLLPCGLSAVKKTHPKPENKVTACLLNVG